MYDRDDPELQTMASGIINAIEIFHPLRATDRARDMGRAAEEGL